MTTEQTMKISPSGAQSLLDVIHQIERASDGEDYRDFVNDVCTAMEKVPDNLKENLRHLAGTSQLVKPHPEPKPPVDWKQCEDEKCVRYPRWPKLSGGEHWHQPAWGQGFDAHIDYEPIPAVVEMRLRDLIAALNDSDAFEDHDQYKGQLEGYLASLRDTGMISSNHPLLVFFDCRSLDSI